MSIRLKSETKSRALGNSCDVALTTHVSDGGGESPTYDDQRHGNSFTDGGDIKTVKVDVLCEVVGVTTAVEGTNTTCTAPGAPSSHWTLADDRHLGSCC